jgi:hypothetical protein
MRLDLATFLDLFADLGLGHFHLTADVGYFIGSKQVYRPEKPVAFVSSDFLVGQYLAHPCGLLDLQSDNATLRRDADQAEGSPFSRPRSHIASV